MAQKLGGDVFGELCTSENGVKWPPARALYGDDVIALTTAEPDLPAAPEITAALRGVIDAGAYGYQDYSPTFGSLVANWLGRRHGLSVDPTHVVFVPRLINAMAVLCNVVLRPGARFVTFSPSYGPIDNVVRANGCRVDHVPLDMSGPRAEIDSAALREAFREPVDVFILCTPHNPTGRVWSREELQPLFELCAAHGTILVSDEVHADLAPAGTHLPALAALDPVSAGGGVCGADATPWPETTLPASETGASNPETAAPMTETPVPEPAAPETFALKTITAFSPAKGFNLAGVEAAALVIPDFELREAINAGMRRAGFTNPNLMALTALGTAWGGDGVWLDEMLALVARNRDRVARFCEKHSLRLLQADATYLVWVDASRLVSCPDAVVESEPDPLAAGKVPAAVGSGISTCSLSDDLAKKTGVLLADGCDYGEWCRGWFRASIATPEHVVAEALERLDRYLSAK
ncbi:MalY/PatB family protein [Dermabacteraceae bacterium P13103]